MKRFFALILSFLTLPFCMEADGYLTGGSEPLPPEIQSELDELSDSIRLGLNTQFLEDAGFSPEKVARVVIDLTRSLEEEKIPGVVIYVDSYVSENMPIAIGNRIISPPTYQTEWSTQYDAEDLTGPIVNIPLTLSLLQSKSIRFNDTLVSGFDADSKSISIQDILLYRYDLESPEKAYRELESPDADLLYKKIIEAKPTEQTNDPSRGAILASHYLLGQALQGPLGKTSKESFRDDLAPTIGMINTVFDEIPNDWRQNIAPGSFTDFTKHRHWGESTDQSVFELKGETAHGGMFTSADDLGLYARFLMASHQMGVNDFLTTETMQMSTMTMRETDDTEFGIGWQLNQFGEGSFGWTTDSGRALWVDPKSGVFCVILMNPEYPEGLQKNYRPLVEKLLQKLHHAVLFYKETASVDAYEKTTDLYQINVSSLAEDQQLGSHFPVG